MIFTIDGVDISPFVALGGYRISVDDVGGNGTVLYLDGSSDVDYLAKKVSLDITCRTITEAEAHTILAAIAPKWVSVQFTDPLSGTVSTKDMHVASCAATLRMRMRNGTEYWDGISFRLVEE